MIALIVVPVLAQNSSEAKSLLDKVSNKYKNTSTFYLKFNSELENIKAKTKESYAGEVYVKGQKYNLSVPKMDIRQIFDGDKLYTISKDQMEVTVTEIDKDSDELFTPTRVFEMYKKGFNLSMDKTGKVNGKTVTYIKLTPTTNDNLKYVLIGINKANNEMVQLVEVNKNDTKTTVTIEKQLNDIIVPKSNISFDKKFYKDYYINPI